MVKNNRLLKIMSILCFIFITISGFLIKNNENIGYEISVYTGVPLSAWVFLISSICCGLGIIIHQVYTQDYKTNKIWIVGLLLILLSNTIILSLHLLRGEYMAAGDPMYHESALSEILKTGHISSKNIYPVTDVYTVSFSYVCNIDTSFVTNYLPIFFAILYVLFMYLFAKSVLPKIGQVLIATVVGTIFIHGWYTGFTPNHFANLVAPMMFFIYMSERNTHYKAQFRILLFILVFLFTMFHPLVGFAILLFFLCIDSFDWFYGKYSKNKVYFHFGLLLVFVIWWISWVSSFAQWAIFLENIASFFVKGGRTSLGDIEFFASQAAEKGFNIFKHFLIGYGPTFVLLILSAIAFIYLLKKRYETEYRNLILLYGPLAIFFIFTGCLLAFYNSPYFSPLRFLIYIIIICTIFAGYMLHKILVKLLNMKRKNISKIGVILITFFLVILSVNCIFTLFSSPYTNSFDYYTTKSEVEGMDWFLHHKNNSIFSTRLWFELHRFPDLLLSDEEKKECESFRYTEEIVPWHFNYTDHSKLGESYTETKYMVLTKMDRLIYEKVYPQIASIRFESSDYTQLENDTSVKKLYSNSELDIWEIQSIKN